MGRKCEQKENVSKSKKKSKMGEKKKERRVKAYNYKSSYTCRLVCSIGSGVGIPGTHGYTVVPSNRPPVLIATFRLNKPGWADI